MAITSSTGATLGDLDGYFHDGAFEQGFDTPELFRDNEGRIRPVTQADMDTLDQSRQAGLDKTTAFYKNNPQAFQQLTADQVAHLSSGLSNDELNAYMGSIMPNMPANVNGTGLYSNGLDKWWGPQEGPRHTDNGGLTVGNLATAGGFVPFQEQTQSAWNDMRSGLAVMFGGPAMGLAGTAAAGAAGVGATTAGGAAVGGTETGITAGAAGSGFGATGAGAAGAETAGAAGAGGGAGGMSEGSLVFPGETTSSGAAGGGALGEASAGGGETLFPGESATSGGAATGSGSMPGDMSNLFPGEANPGAAAPQSGSLLDFLSRGPGDTSSFGGLQPSDLMRSGLNLGIQQLLAQRQQGQAQQVQQAGNPLNDPQRAPFQQQATNMVTNPQDYFANNPFASSLAAYFKNGVIPSQVAKSGNPAEVLDRTGSQFANALGGNYNQLLATLQGYGGFNQGNSGVGASVPLLQGSNNSANESFRALGGLASKSIDSIFGDVTRPGSNGGTGSVFGGTGVSA